jgi:hypothetical protein
MNLRGYDPSVNVYPSLCVPEDDAEKGKEYLSSLRKREQGLFYY